MKELISTLFNALFLVLDKKLLYEWLDAALDILEDMIEESPSEWDDILVQPIITHIRNVFGIEDNDEEIIE